MVGAPIASRMRLQPPPNQACASALQLGVRLSSGELTVFPPSLVVGILGARQETALICRTARLWL